MRTSDMGRGRIGRWAGRGAGGLLLRLGLAAAACGALAAGAASCSLIVQADTDQCKAASDCKGFSGLRSCAEGVCAAVTTSPACTQDADCKTYADAVCSSSVCVRATCTTDDDCGVEGVTCQSGKCAPTVTPTECTVNADCAAKGQYYICRKDTHVCASLVNEQCTVVAGKYQDDNAFIIGSILPTIGGNDAAGLAMEKGALLAVQEFDQIANGLPPKPGTTARRPLVMVGCTDESNADKAVTAATHLVDNVGVSAIVGAAYSGITIKFTTTVTIPKNVLVISPSATSVAITSLQDNNLVWRTSPSDVFQSTALAGYMPILEQKVRVDLNLPDPTTQPIKVAILYKGDAYGTGLSEALEGLIKFNGTKDATMNGANFSRKNYGNPDDPTVSPTTYSDRVNDMLAFKPHVLFILGTAETITEIMSKVEDNWPLTDPMAPGYYRPRYVFGDGGQVVDLWDYIKATESKTPLPPGADDLRKRASGSVPGTEGALFNAFILNYQAKFGNDPDPHVFGPAGAYDSIYMLAYAAASLGDKPLTGPNLATGLTKLVPPGTALPVGSSKINEAFTALIAGSSIDFSGASGPLNFDTKTGEAPGDIQIWCVPKGLDGKATSAINSGIYYDAAQSKLVGTGFGTQCD